jgi:hypothetical protein
MPQPVPQDEADYVMCRMYIEVGALAYQKWKDTGVWPETDPPTSKLIDTLLEFITPDVLPLNAEEIAILAKSGNKQLPPELRRGDIIFRNREALVEGLNTMAPATADAIKKKAPGADEGDLEWWAVTLSSAGALALIGLLSWRGKLIALVAAALLAGASAYLGLTAKTEDGQNAIKAAWQYAKEAAENTFGWVKWAVGGVLVVGAGIAIYSAVKSTPAKRGLPAIRSRDDDMSPRTKRLLETIDTTEEEF